MDVTYCGKAVHFIENLPVIRSYRSGIQQILVLAQQTEFILYLVKVILLNVFGM
jgi:hypothetical protein